MESNVSCIGISNVSLNETATCGTAPYSGSVTFTGLTAGTYPFPFTAPIRCTATTSATVSEPSALSALVSQNAPILCHCGDTTANVSCHGGTSPYSVIGNFTVTAGTYNYTFTDSHGSTASTSITVYDNSALLV